MSDKKGTKKVAKAPASGAAKKPAEKKETKKAAAEPKEAKDLYASDDHVPYVKPMFGKDKEGKDVPLDKIDWADRDMIISTFPSYIQVQLNVSRGKILSKAVDIEFFSMKAPLSASYLLKDTPLTLAQNTKAVIIGDSGTGKSTLFRELAAGRIKDFPKHLFVHHCQEIELSPHAMSVIDTVVKAHEFRNVLVEIEPRIKAALEKEEDPARKSKIKENWEYIEMSLNRIQSATAYDRASKMLRVLGFDEGGQQKSTNALSGGLRMRVALCAAFFAEPDLVLLDEPTNHLDFPSVLWLENRLRALRTSFVMVCHDRHLLNSVCSSVIAIEEQKLNYFPMGFEAFEKKRETLHKKKAEDIEKFMQKYRSVDFSSPLAKEKAEKKAWLDYWHARQMLLAGKFVFPDAQPLPVEDGVKASDIKLVDVQNVTFSYDVKTGIWIFKDPINLTITTSSRMGLMGPNGAGKSTLLKLICDKLVPTTGVVYRHPTATVAYFAQHHVLDLDLNITPMEYMIKTFPEVEKAGLLRAHLNKVGLVGDKAETRMKSLSAGLRSCVCFAKITYYCPHLLIMDEPTNFLDLESVDALIGATNKFKGALLLVSHNRSFLLKCAKRYISVVPGKFDIFDDLKTCERATYQFIEEMESGVKVSTQNLVANNPSADAANSVRDAAAKLAAEKAAGASSGVISISSAPVAKPAAAAAPAAAPAAAAAKPAPAAPAAKAAPAGDAKKAGEESLVGRKCTAVWAVDGARYPATVIREVGNGEIEVDYTGYNEVGIVKIVDVVFKHAGRQAQGDAGKPQGKAAAGAGAGGRQQGGAQPRQQRQSRQGGGH